MTKTVAILTARLIFAAVFLMACGFKFADMDSTAGYIAAVGFPAPLLLAYCAVSTRPPARRVHCGDG
jgi:uncharacterized membrane protein YphA (DoxX/SURF4 family)